jgi:hypothetical protein
MKDIRRWQGKPWSHPKLTSRTASNRTTGSLQLLFSRGSMYGSIDSPPTRELRVCRVDHRAHVQTSDISDEELQAAHAGTISANFLLTKLKSPHFVYLQTMQGSDGSQWNPPPVKMRKARASSALHGLPFQRLMQRAGLDA